MLKEYQMPNSVKVGLEDMSILKKILDGEVEVNNIENDVKLRLITMCREQLENIEQKIKKNN